jgi:hypothetical protein
VHSSYKTQPYLKRDLWRLAAIVITVPVCLPRPRWEDNIKMDLQEVGWGMDWIELAQDRDRWRVL